MTHVRTPFPTGGQNWSELRQAMSEKSKGDIDWRHGRSPLFVFFNDEDTLDIGRKAYFEYFSENALGGKRAFFGIGQMEKEVIDYGLDLLHASSDAAGIFSNGGSESIFLAVKAARDAHRAATGDRTRPLNVVMPITAHPAFDKAANAMDLELRRAPVRADKRCDVDTMRPLIDEDTMLLVGSAPCYPHGVVDPVDDIAKLALEFGVWMHVDACVGGWVAPFFQRNGRQVPAFDFAISGVRSISADLHKFGFCPKPASTVFFHDRTDMERARFVADAWPSGVFQTSTLAGTRPAGAVAAAWSVINHLGTVGYERAAKRLADMVDAYVADLSSIDGLEFWARPDLTIINFGSHDLDIFAVAEHMSERGWLPALTRKPKGIHLMMSLLHEPSRQEFVDDARRSFDLVKKTGAKAERISARY